MLCIESLDGVFLGQFTGGSDSKKELAGSTLKVTRARSIDEYLQN